MTTGFTLQHYQNLAASPLWMSAALRSLGIGFGAAILAMLERNPVAMTAAAHAAANSALAVR